MRHNWPLAYCKQEKSDLLFVRWNRSTQKAHTELASCLYFQKFCIYPIHGLL